MQPFWAHNPSQPIGNLLPRLQEPFWQGSCMSFFPALHHLLLHLDIALELSWSKSFLWSLRSLVTVLACMVMSLACCKVMSFGFLTRKALSLSMTLAACSNRSSASFLCPLLSLLVPLAFVKLSSKLLAAPWHKSLAFLALVLASSHGSFFLLSSSDSFFSSSSSSSTLPFSMASCPLPLPFFFL